MKVWHSLTMKLIVWFKYSRCSAKESSVLSKRIVGAKRKQSIYSQKPLNCYASGGSNTGQKHSQIIVFPLGFREVFSLLPSCLCGFILSNTMELGGFRKDTYPKFDIHSLFSLLSSTLRFSFAVLCTTKFSWFWFFWRAFSIDASLFVLLSALNF